MLTRSGWIRVSALPLAACATTPYQPNGLRGGYFEIRLGPDSCAVGSRGNGDSPPIQAQSMPMLRGAELRRDVGYRWKAAVKSDSKVDRDVFTRPAETRINAYVNTNRRDRHTGSTGYVTMTPEQTTVIEQPVAQMEIRCLKTNPRRYRRIPRRQIHPHGRAAVRSITRRIHGLILQDPVASIDRIDCVISDKYQPSPKG